MLVEKKKTENDGKTEQKFKKTNRWENEKKKLLIFSHNIEVVWFGNVKTAFIGYIYWNVLNVGV